MKYCKKCGGDSYIYDSRPDSSGCVIRSRKCEKCGHKWRTIEVEYWNYKNMLKKKEGDDHAELL
jgi:transcriptional regulator NrdR family protein